MKLGIIGGSGLEKLDVLNDSRELKIDTPYGEHSPMVQGRIGEVDIIIVSRHGYKHEITPTKVNNRANIWVLKNQGCGGVIATTAVGSLRDYMAPGEFVIANQFIDFTKHRAITFHEDFKNGVNHVSLSDPFSDKLRQYLIEACDELNFSHHRIGTILTVEGPRFSTRAESFMFRKFAHLINMSTAPEAILAKEAGLEYAVIAMVTDYDCWKKSEEDVTWEMVEKRMRENSENVLKVLLKVVDKFGKKELMGIDRKFVSDRIRTIPNFPKPGIMFRDITTLFKDREGMKKVVDIFYERYKDRNIDIVAGIESRGFILGGILAEKLNAGFVPIRKRGKLPHETINEEYDLEYGTDVVEIHKDSINPRQRVLIVDDLIATGGTAEASCKLVERLGGEIVETAFIIDLVDLRGKEKLRCPVFSIVSFEGE